MDQLIETEYLAKDYEFIEIEAFYGKNKLILVLP